MAVERHGYLHTDDVYVADVCCADPPRGWTEVRPAEVFGLVLVRRGLVRGRVDGAERLLDPATVYVERPGAEQQFAHPSGGDVYTEIVLSEPCVAGLLGGDPAVPEGLAHVTTELALRHRLLLTRARSARDDAFGLGERAVSLAAAVFAQIAPGRVMSGRPATAAARQRIVDDARAALCADPGLRLEALSRAVACSPHHLSRVFTAVTGVTLTRYRERLRLARALDRLSEGETDLRLLAAELGFSDQAHLTHAVRRSAGLPPGRLRAVLRGAPDGRHRD
ncbi:AraC family transcriptional regulator [Streptomyces albus]|uniref:helix-turn-helix domain-containing protein n=1 Tax=Streptomyces albus TaxID=1888 RepID=UPI00055D56AB|nr:AraC family transcriptional regulator [Streptomyces albus]